MTKFGRFKIHRAHLSKAGSDRFFRKINKKLPSASGPLVMSICFYLLGEVCLFVFLYISECMKHNTYLRAHFVAVVTYLSVNKSPLAQTHNTPLLPPKILNNHCLLFLLGYEDGPKRNLKQCLCTFLGSKRGVLWDL